MKVVYKYELHRGITTLSIPDGAKLLTVNVQDDVPRLWAEVDTDKPDALIRIQIFATGQPFPEDMTFTYISTFFVDGGVYVFHAYRVD